MNILDIKYHLLWVVLYFTINIKHYIFQYEINKNKYSGKSLCSKQTSCILGLSLNIHCNICVQFELNYKSLDRTILSGDGLLFNILKICIYIYIMVLSDSLN